MNQIRILAALPGSGGGALSWLRPEGVVKPAKPKPVDIYADLIVKDVVAEVKAPAPSANGWSDKSFRHNLSWLSSQGRHYRVKDMTDAHILRVLRGWCAPGAGVREGDLHAGLTRKSWREVFVAEAFDRGMRI